MQPVWTGLFYRLAIPTRLSTVSAVFRPFCFWAAAIFFIFGLYLALLASPPDYQQGDAVRIMYVHVPAAWLGLSSYLGLGLCALFYVVWRHPLANIAARAIAPIGAGFTALGNMVGMGCPADLYASIVIFLYWFRCACNGG